MEKMKIDVGKLTYAPNEGEPVYPLPIGVNWEGEVEVFGRLIKTKGNGANWKFENANFELSKSRSPKIHLQGKAIIEINDYREFPQYGGYKPTLQILRLKGYEGRDIHLRVVFTDRKLLDLTKRKERADFIKSVSEKITNKSPQIKQGNLEGYSLDLELPEELVLSGKRMKILNHEFYSRRGLFRWIGYDYSAVIQCSYGVYIVSPDHLEAPCSILSEGCYFFTHPEPNKD